LSYAPWWVRPYWKIRRWPFRTGRATVPWNRFQNRRLSILTHVSTCSQAM